MCSPYSGSAAARRRSLRRTKGWANQTAAEYRKRIIGVDFTAVADYSTRFPFIIVGEIGGVRTTLVTGSLVLIPEYRVFSGNDYGGIWQ